MPRTVTSRAVRSPPLPLPDPAYAGHRRFAPVYWSWVSPRRLLLPYGAGLSSLRPSPRGRRRSGDCLVSFGAQYRGFARPCHPALRIPIASVAAILREARQILSAIAGVLRLCNAGQYAEDRINAMLMYNANIMVRLPAMPITGLWYFFATFATPIGTLP